MAYEYAMPKLQEANLAAVNGEVSEMYRLLRSLPLADFCEILYDVPAEFPALAAALPTMPSPDMQKRWTGHHGRELLVKSCNIIRLFQTCSFLTRGKGVTGNVLDYGCGWGRLIRLSSYMVDPNSVYGVDPMMDSLNACANHRVKANFSLIDALPHAFPIPGVKFNFAYAYSVMTHTSLESTEAILRCVREVIDDDGIFACTIRPIEFWSHRRVSLGDECAQDLINQHRSTGYAFVPVGGGQGLTKEHYGDSSFSFEFFAKLAEQTGWKLSRIDRDMLEPFQIMVTLAKN